MSAEQQLGQKAIVIGAGMGGLMAASVLARYFSEVLVLDRDRLPESVEARSGVPQGAHVHTLMVQGRRNMEKMFPGLTSDLIDSGGVISRLGLEFRVHDWLGWFPVRDLGLPSLFVTRPLLEGTVRTHLARNLRTTIRDGATVTGWKQDGQRIAVMLAGETSETLTADFVVDASGRSGQAKEMLAANGHGPVEEIVMQTGESYATTFFEIPEGWDNTCFSFAVNATAPDSRSGFLFAVEGNRWMCSLTGRFDEAPPRDLEGFMAFAKKLPNPCIYDRISKARQIGPIRAYNPVFSRWRRYDKLADFSDRVLPLGDAIAHVNPIYGQGMTLASTHAVGLWDVLKSRAEGGQGMRGVAKEYLEATAAFTGQVWSGLEIVDFAYPKTIGERPADIEQRTAFTYALRRLMVDDAEVHRLGSRVNQLIEPSSALMRDDILARVQAIMAQEQTQ
jgi:2-polyprenyl-6-methoxyphenol hydroxylase-like FAD-dependent oxidoreductase